MNTDQIEHSKPLPGGLKGMLRDLSLCWNAGDFGGASTGYADVIMNSFVMLIRAQTVSGGPS